MDGDNGTYYTIPLDIIATMRPVRPIVNPVLTIDGTLKDRVAQLHKEVKPITLPQDRDVPSYRVTPNSTQVACDNRISFFIPLLTLDTDITAV